MYSSDRNRDLKHYFFRLFFSTQIPTFIEKNKGEGTMPLYTHNEEMGVNILI